MAPVCPWRKYYSLFFCVILCYIIIPLFSQAIKNPHDVCIYDYWRVYVSHRSLEKTFPVKLKRVSL